MKVVPCLAVVALSTRCPLPHRHAICVRIRGGSNSGQLSRRYAHLREDTCRQSVTVGTLFRDGGGEPKTREHREEPVKRAHSATLGRLDAPYRVAPPTPSPSLYEQAQRTDGGCNNKLVLTSGPTVQSSVVRARGKILSPARPERGSKKNNPPTARTTTPLGSTFHSRTLSTELS